MYIIARLPNVDSQITLKIKEWPSSSVILTDTQKIMTLKTDDCIATIITKLSLLTEEIAFQNAEQEKRADELIIPMKN